MIRLPDPDTVDGIIVSSEWNITPEMIDRVMTYIENKILSATIRKEKRVEVSPRELREHFNTPKGLMTEILKIIEKNPGRLAGIISKLNVIK